MADDRAPRAADRRFRVAGFGERDALVVRSMVRLLDGRTRDHWTASDADPVHVCIVPVGAAEPVPPDTLVLHVALPLRADDLWSQLDRASGQLAETHRTARTGRPAGAASASAAPAGERRLQLLRWPPDELLRSDLATLRLATMLGSRPFTMADLSARSGVPLAACHTFAAVLHAHGVAQWLIGDEVVDGPGAGEGGGLIARIRARLKPEGSR